VVISLIAAIDTNYGIGNEGKLLCPIPEDLQWFKQHTQKKIIVMGRATYESIGKPLPKRVNVVLSKDKNYQPHKDVMVRNSIDQILFEFGNEKELMVIGGGTVYKQFLPYATKLYLTELHKKFTADTFFPEFDTDLFIKYYTREGAESTGFKYTFNVYKKRLK
jgi:dihydrofolate reductase